MIIKIDLTCYHVIVDVITNASQEEKSFDRFIRIEA